MPKVNSKPKGFNAMAKMLRWSSDNPAEFKKICHKRNPVENAFSAIKERFGAVAHAKLEHMTQFQLVLNRICYNLIA